PPAPPASPAAPGADSDADGGAPASLDDATVVSVSGRSARALAAQQAQSGAEQTMIPPTETASGDDADGADAVQAGDHDGMAIVGLDLQRLRERRGDAERSAPQAADSPSEAKSLALRLPDGTIEPITHEVVLGRSPSASQLAGGRLPKVVAIGAGDHDISRNHVRVTVEGDTVVVTDLHSRNGTHVAQPGKAPVRLRAGEPTPVLTGTVVDLGGGWTLQVVAI
ncbi:FHA domain-containing protein, partial [Agromyces terreus]|uniref:FHA domain-containing protein n=1 Tax=Agromyces terreus TaxID=424795 RepID=UPI0031D65541